MSRAYYILLNDLHGVEKTFFRSKQCLVEKGTLLYAITDHARSKDGKPPHNYRCFGDKNVTLHADGREVALLSEKEFGLLAGIRSPSDRYRVFSTEGWLKWGAHVRCGSSATASFAAISAGGFVTTEVDVRYVGKMTGDEPGVWFGVEITVRLLHHNCNCF